MFKSSLADNSSEPAPNNGKTETPVLFIVGNRTNEPDAHYADDEKMPKRNTNAFQRQQSEKVLDIVVRNFPEWSLPTRVRM